MLKNYIFNIYIKIWLFHEDVRHEYQIRINQIFSFMSHDFNVSKFGILYVDDAFSWSTVSNNSSVIRPGH